MARADRRFSDGKLGLHGSRLMDGRSSPAGKHAVPENAREIDRFQQIVHDAGGGTSYLDKQRPSSFALIRCA